MSESEIKVEKLLDFCGISAFVEPGDVSDGFHSYNQLYDHRDTLFLCLVNILFERGYDPQYRACKSKLHSDGTHYEGYFIVMITDVVFQEQISYHLSIEKYWDLCNLEPVEKAPKWDGHSSDDVVQRLIKWFL